MAMIPESVAEEIIRRSNIVEVINTFVPLKKERWEELGQIKMADDTMATFLMTTKVGKGMLVVCSADFGLSGGLVMFGSTSKNQCVKLLCNLYNMHKKSGESR